MELAKILLGLTLMKTRGQVRRKRGKKCSPEGPSGKKRTRSKGADGARAKRFNSCNLRGVGTKTKETQTDVSDVADTTTAATTAAIVLPVIQENKETQTERVSFAAAAGTHAAADKEKDAAIEAVERLKKAVPAGQHWKSKMVVVMLRYVFGMIKNHNWGYTAACTEAASLFMLHKATVFEFARKYKESEEILPLEREVKTRGRGSATFIAGGADRFSELKNEHLVMITNFVHERTVSQRGMCNVQAIRTHLLRKTEIHFAHHVVYYALRHRCGFKYRTPLRK